MVGLNSILTEAWNTSHQAQDKREKLQALSLAKECYCMKLELLTCATVVDDAIRFVSEMTTTTKKDGLISEEEESQTIAASATAAAVTHQVF
jgi:hypothetical protein